MWAVHLMPRTEPIAHVRWHNIPVPGPYLLDRFMIIRFMPVPCLMKGFYLSRFGYFLFISLLLGESTSWYWVTTTLICGLAFLSTHGSNFSPLPLCRIWSHGTTLYKHQCQKSNTNHFQDQNSRDLDVPSANASLPPLFVVWSSFLCISIQTLVFVTCIIYTVSLILSPSLKEAENLTN